MGLRAGERISVRDLLYGLILRSGNDAAHDAGGRRRRLAGALRAADEPLRRGARPRRHPLRQPGRPRPARQLLQRPRPGDADPAPAADPGLRQDRRLAQRRPAQRPSRRGGSRRSTSCCDDAPWVNGVKTGHTFGAALRPGRLGPAQGRRADLGRDRGADRRRPLLRQPRTARIRLLASTGGGGRSTPARTSPIPRSATRAASCRCGPPAASPSACAAASGSASRSGRPSEVEGPIRRGAPLGRATVFVDGRHAATVALRAGRSIPKASAFDRVRGFVDSHSIPIALAVFVILIGGILLYRRAVPRKR